MSKQYKFVFDSDRAGTNGFGIIKVEAVRFGDNGIEISGFQVKESLGRGGPFFWRLYVVLVVILSVLLGFGLVLVVIGFAVTPDAVGISDQGQILWMAFGIGLAYPIYRFLKNFGAKRFGSDSKLEINYNEIDRVAVTWTEEMAMTQIYVREGTKRPGKISIEFRTSKRKHAALETHLVAVTGKSIERVN